MELFLLDACDTEKYDCLVQFSMVALIIKVPVLPTTAAFILPVVQISTNWKRKNLGNYY